MVASTARALGARPRVSGRGERALFGTAGRADSEWVVAEERGLLQGCPFSPILMKMMMSLYADKIRKEVAEGFPEATTKLRLSLSIDDLIVWVVGWDM